jgi:hypothetical protein
VAVSDRLPSELRSKLPPAYPIFADHRVFWVLLGFGLCVYSLYGAIVIKTRYFDGGLCVLGPVLGPGLAALWYRFLPLNPYQIIAGRFVSGSVVQRGDSDRKRLIELFRSPVAFQFATRRCGQLAAVLAVISAVLVTSLRGRMMWSFNFYTVSVGILVCFFAAQVVVNTEVLCWGVRTWAEASTTDTETSC